ncbi:hypothetical protein ACFT9I_33340 [Streptomyces sp. NPDC057137]|uniref:hypothetical protein n=1 Tax=Streptomyces sp. NPDC057137 TaxID=3346030 RepID=UPI00363AECE9
MRRTRSRGKRGRGVPATVAGTLAVAATVVALLLSAQHGTGCDTSQGTRLSARC